MATYYVRADGTAANKAAATSDSAASTSMSMTTCNSESSGFSGGDIVIISDAGGSIYRNKLKPLSSGTSGAPITYQASGNVVICGADVLASWTQDGTYPNIYYATWGQINGDRGLWYDGTAGVNQSSLVNCTELGDFYFDDAADRIYLWTGDGNDPDSYFDEVEVATNARWEGCIYVDSYDYLVFDGLECRYTVNNVCRVRNGGVGVTFKNCKIHGAAEGKMGASYQSGIAIEDYSDVLIQSCEIYRNAWNGTQTTNGTTGTISNVVVEKCLVYDNGHNGIDSKTFSSGDNSGFIYRYNRVYNNADNGLMMLANDDATGDFVDSVIIGNVVFKNTSCGMYLASEWGATYFTGFAIVNNTVANNGQGTWGNGIWFGGSASVIKNNIVCNSDEDEPEIAIADGGGTANVVDYNLVYYDGVKADLYSEDGTDYTHAEYQTFGQQAHGVNADPAFTNAASDDYTLSSSSPCIGAGENLGASYDDALLPSSTWPDGVVTGDQDDY